MLSIKCQKDGQWRRFTCNNSYEGLERKTRTIFKVHFADSMELKYQDDEGDQVTLSSEDELAEALRVCKEPLKVYVSAIAEHKDEKHAEDHDESEYVSVARPLLARLHGQARCLLAELTGFEAKKLKKVEPVVKSVVDVLGTRRVFSQRQDKEITLLVPRAQQDKQKRVSCDALIAARGQLRPAVTKVKTLVGLIGTDRVYSERQGKVITLLQPGKHSPCTPAVKPTTSCNITRGALMATRGQLRRLSPSTRVKTIVDMLGTKTVYSERQGRVIELLTPLARQPAKAEEESSGARPMVKTQRSCYGASAAVLGDARRDLSPASTKVKTIIDLIGTSQVYSERQGKAITLLQPGKVSCAQQQGQQWTPPQRCPVPVLREMASARRVGLACPVHLRSTATRVKTIVDMLGTKTVYSERQGRVIELLTPLARQPAKAEEESSEARSMVKTQHSSECYGASAAVLGDARRHLSPAFTKVKGVVELLGTSRVFSERQGKAIELLTPLAAQTQHAKTQECPPCAQTKSACPDLPSQSPELGAALLLVRALLQDKLGQSVREAPSPEVSATVVQLLQAALA